MNSLDCYATQFQYLSHTAEILRRVPHRLYVPNRLLPYAKQLGFLPRIGKPPEKGGPILVAGYHDSRAVRYRPRIYLEHGAGQTYDLGNGYRHPCYSGGKGHEGTVLFLCPSETVARRWREHYDAPAVVVGCPKLDSLREIPIGDEVAVSFHSNVDLVPETRNAFPHYAPVLKELSERFPLIGHAHPRLLRRIRPFYEANWIEVVADFEEVVRRAGVYCVDNSSTGPEFASLGRSIVWLNAPWYRRDIQHGGRFWDWTQDIPTAEAPNDLYELIPLALESPKIRLASMRMAQSVYDWTDDKASVRAANAINHILG